MHDGKLSGITSCNHKNYHLHCNSMNDLLIRSGGCCEICRIPGIESAHRMLYIDHDRDYGKWGVRGLLCGTCNTKLEHENRFSEAADLFLQRAWFKQQLADLGVDEDGGPEPDGQQAFRDCKNRFWVKSKSKGLWIARHNRGRVSDYAWDDLNYKFGPFNLRPVPLAEIPKDHWWGDPNCSVCNEAPEDISINRKGSHSMKFFVNSGFHCDVRVWECTPEAIGLWTLAASWTVAQDQPQNFVPAEALERLLPDSLLDPDRCEHASDFAKELVVKRLWEEVEGGYVFADWNTGA